MSEPEEHPAPPPRPSSPLADMIALVNKVLEGQPLPEPDPDTDYRALAREVAEEAARREATGTTGTNDTNTDPNKEQP